ncbi:MAG: DUF2218 domain-containing protein [Pseudomonadota bacterium]
MQDTPNITGRATFRTDAGQRHLDSLCRHFGRKVETGMTTGSGWVQFPFGRCEMAADATRLRFSALAPDAAGLDEVITVMTRHLERYAFREDPRLDWQLDPASAPTFTPKQEPPCTEEP